MEVKLKPIIIKYNIMKIYKSFVIIGLYCISLAWHTVSVAQPAGQSSDLPNIIYILADDLGYGELGIMGHPHIETPNIDRLAEDGMTFTDHYSGSPVCAPARYTLMTGKHTGNAYIRGNDVMPERGDVWNYEVMFDEPEMEGDRPIPLETVTVAEVLKSAGYTTAAIGKWGLGAINTTGHPNKHGFDLFYGYLCQRQAHTYYPTHLWKNEQRVLLDNELVNPHQRLPEGLDPYDDASYAKFQDQPDYSAELMHIEALRFIEENQNDPFFLYLPTPIPHVSLQAPRRWVEYYVEKFGDEEPYYEGRDVSERQHPVQYTPVRYPRATYAAMISYLDEQIGEIVEKLKELGIYENTLIMFSSDNGPLDGLGVDQLFFDSASPFLSISGWVKGSLREGGIRVPMIATWEDRIPAGSTTDHISAFWDIMPTFAEIVGAEPPEDINGISFLPVLEERDHEQRRHEYLYWEFPGGGGQQVVRIGRWKGVRMGIKSEGNLEIELYDLTADPQEQHNLADRYPAIVEKMEEIMRTARTKPDPELVKFHFPVLGDVY